jgi:hypothetical protein
MKDVGMVIVLRRFWCDRLRSLAVSVL